MTSPRFAAAFAALLAVLVCLPTAAQEAPFIGVVKENSVEVRSGAGRAYYVVGALKKGDMARVEKVLFNQTWYQIRVPKGVHSYVSKAFVDAQGDGESGKINADRTEFKAASLRGPGESYRVQGTLSKGDTVEILGEEGNFYKISSPNDSFVFIPAGTLRQATKDDLEAAGGDQETQKPDETPEEKPEPVEPVQPVDPKPEPVEPKPEPVEPKPEPVDPKPEPVEPVEPVKPEPKPEPVKPPTVPSTKDGWPAPPSVKVTTPARSDTLKELEMQVLPYFSLPVKQQPLDKMAKAYQDMAKVEGLPSIDEQIITVRLRQIERRQEILDTLKRAEVAEKIDLGKTQVPTEEELDPLPIRYTAVGVLKPSTVYDGKSLPLLYRLVDAAPSGRTIAYVTPNADINIAAMLNQLVGVVGETSYNRTLKLQIIEISRAVALEADEPEEDTAEEPAEEASDQASESAEEASE